MSASRRRSSGCRFGNGFSLKRYNGALAARRHLANPQHAIHPHLAISRLCHAIFRLPLKRLKQPETPQW
ncbi:hypothetical protein [Kingella bonacorsii]|uniref:Uncharacterized protein n=1 Tax=Kingella bonacorsii TaxID=2796361 RepID=A0ABS1BUM4_9NEIS|nr:hypothetical protein [Kingella bonacorsii]MBK0396975.1 hypothetical protein [Kingella bonacorsii]